MTTRLAGRRVLVTGASSGIGRATAQALHAAGARVALVARRRERLVTLARELEAVAVPVDVTDVAAVSRAVTDAATALDGLDGVVNAAGIVRPAPFSVADPADWRAMFDVNVLGLLQVTQAALPHLREAGHGDVVNVSSMSGRRVGSSELAVYAASKAAVHMASEGLRKELAAESIRVSVVAPGFVATPIFEDVEGEVARRLDDKAQQVGLPVTAVADAIVGILAAPAEMVHVEVALLSTRQG